MTRAAENLASAELLLEQRRLPEAAYLFYRAEAEGCDADRCAAGRWMAAMLSGNFEAGWRESDSIRFRGAPDPYRFWQGEDLAGKRIIVRCLHGFGDAVQFLRYALLLKLLATQVTVECAPPMVGLARCLPGIDEVITWGRDAPTAAPAWQVQLETMELPYIFRSTLGGLPIATGYLAVPVSAVRCAGQIFSGSSRFQIGVVWASGEWNPKRSLPLDILRPIFNRAECQYWNLQGGAIRAQWQSLGPRANLFDHPLLDDAGLVPLAGIIAQLDLVITVDTLAAHLAGALNVPCFLMLQYAADWRWMVDRDDSPWYPSVRLFRQPQPGDWISVVRQLDAALDAQLYMERKLRSIA